MAEMSAEDGGLPHEVALTSWCPGGFTPQSKSANLEQAPCSHKSTFYLVTESFSNSLKSILTSTLQWEY